MLVLLDVLGALHGFPVALGVQLEPLDCRDASRIVRQHADEIVGKMLDDVARSDPEMAESIL